MDTDTKVGDENDRDMDMEHWENLKMQDMGTDK